MVGLGQCVDASIYDGVCSGTFKDNAGCCCMDVDVVNMLVRRFDNMTPLSPHCAKGATGVECNRMLVSSCVASNVLFLTENGEYSTMSTICVCTVI
jgi:hypothetical protein